MVPGSPESPTSAVNVDYVSLLLPFSMLCIDLVPQIMFYAFSRSHKPRMIRNSTCLRAYITEVPYFQLLTMRRKVKDLKGSGVSVRFGPLSDPKKFEIDLLEEARRRLSLNTIDDFDELELEIGDRLGERPYTDTGRAKMMPLQYPCEGSVWLNFVSLDGRCANISVVPFMDETGHGHSLPPHHNFYLYWTNFDGSIDSDKRISGHRISIGEPIVISIICGKEVRKGTIDVKP